MKPNRLTIAALLAAVCWGCATGDLLGDFNLISPQEEVQLGNNLAQEILSQKKQVNDTEVNGFINAIGQKLTAVSMNPNANYHFYVIEDPEVNAFAIPGGHLFVQTGLIQAADNEAEIAAVMGHELGHAEQRHPTESLSRQMGAQMVAQMVLGENSAPLLKTAASLMMSGGISAYSRSAETQADEISVYLLNRAGYDPGALVSFFKKLAALEQQSGGAGMGALFASHPPTPDRIAAAEKLIASFGEFKQQKTQLVGGLASVKQKLAGK
ncbi:MAG: M48 family metalloprotease [bacterium]|nr:M48 family metalloprotease [bacterium]